MIENVIIQAGGKGERAGKYAKNKPKCLISILGKPLLFHICDQFPDANIHLILAKNSKNEKVVERFLELHPDYQNHIHFISTEYNTGDSSSLKDVLSLCVGHTIICWSDILFKLPEFNYEQDTVFTTNVIPCRWKIKDGVIQQQNGDGIMGCFYIADPNASVQYFLNDGCIITTLQNKEYQYTTAMIDCKEFGMEDELVSHYSQTTPVRHYNKLVITDSTVEKASKDGKLIAREIGWYDSVAKLGFTNAPKKLKDNPLTLERIHGSNVYEYLQHQSLSPVVIFDLLDKLHSLKHYPPSPTNHKQVIIDETLRRLGIVASIHEIFEKDVIWINSVKCINYIKQIDKLETKLKIHLLHEQNVVTAHGDPILSNILIDQKDNLYLIDPRGYYGDTEGPIGTALYDYAKLYFSAVMNFDTFNRKLFSLTIGEGASIDIDSRTYCQDFEYYFNLKFNDYYIFKIKLLAATMWLRFGSCVLDDYDSIVGSIVYGLYSINSVLSSLEHE
jgi:hypothetical protein